MQIAGNGTPAAAPRLKFAAGEFSTGKAGGD
jgi:hypothetical protein